MNARLKWMCVAFSAVLVAGCGGFRSDMRDFAVILDFARTIEVPQEIPAEILAVMAEPDRFSPQDHPLRNVAAGTVVDDLAGLDGCWGRAELDAWDGTFDGSCDVLTLDRISGLATHYQGYAQPRDFPGGPDQLSVNTYAYEVLSNQRVRLELLERRAGVVDEQGQIKPLPLFLWLIGWGMTEDCIDSDDLREPVIMRMLVTLEGDYLKTCDPEWYDCDDPELGDLWVRMDCSD